MAKNTKKKAKEKAVEEKEVKFTLPKAEFKDIFSKILKFNGSYYVNNDVLNGVNLVLEKDELTLAATDGNTLLKLTKKLENFVEEKINVILSGMHLEKMKLSRDYCNRKKSLSMFDILEITIKEKYATIEDVRNNIVYTIPYIVAQYPNYDGLIPKDVIKNEDYVKLGINPALLSKLNVLNDRGLPIILAINKENKHAAVYFEANRHEENAKGLIMPCIMSELEE